jgi:hypothetical protein
VARYADACNLFAFEPGVVRHKLEVLERHCDAESRDPADIKKTILVANPLHDVDAFLATMADLSALGVDLVETMPDGPDPVAFVSELGEHVMPRLRDL